MKKTKKSATSALTALGNKVTKFARFETFPTPAGVTYVKCVSDEVTANCPITNQPDWYEVHIAYRPDKLCVESKTLKLYFHSYRNKGLFCEAFAAKIADDLFLALSPKTISVEVIQKPRGGISIHSTAHCQCAEVSFVQNFTGGATKKDLERMKKVITDDMSRGGMIRRAFRS